uniref:Co-chaperone protein p23 n=1 Tax=Ananas comosus var. bracteatus TaxID=296719 RepID=A0A6V7NFJ7_ANACO|nr:unnamed protein product [Ananas comosus var. bracteatus]
MDPAATEASKAEEIKRGRSQGVSDRFGALMESVEFHRRLLVFWLVLDVGASDCDETWLVGFGTSRGIHRALTCNFWSRLAGSKSCSSQLLRLLDLASWSLVELDRDTLHTRLGSAHECHSGVRLVLLRWCRSCQLDLLSTDQLEWIEPDSRNGAGTGVFTVPGTEPQVPAAAPSADLDRGKGCLIYRYSYRFVYRKNFFVYGGSVGVPGERVIRGVTVADLAYSGVSLHPTLKWAQRSDKLYLTIDLPDAKDVKLNLEPEGKFTFSATKDGALYELDIELFDKVDTKESKSNIGVRNIVYVAKKAEKKWWSRLLKQEGKPPAFVKVDWDKWIDEDEEDVFNVMKFLVMFLNKGMIVSMQKKKRRKKKLKKKTNPLQQIFRKLKLDCIGVA